MLKQITKPFERLGRAVNDIFGDAIIELAKVIFVGVVLGLIATVAVLTFTAIMMVIL